MLTADPAPVVDLIYESAFVPEHWPTALHHLSTLTDSVGGCLFVASGGQVPRWTASPAIYAAMEQFVSEGWNQLNRRPARAVSLGGIVRDVDMLTEAELATDPVRNDFLARHGLASDIGFASSLPTGDYIVFTWERAIHLGTYHDAHVQALEAMRPHLARAGLMAARMGLERARTAVMTLDLIGLPAAVMASPSRVVVVNPRFEALSSCFIPRALGGLAVSHPPANQLLHDTLHRLSRSPTADLQSIPIPASEEHPALVVHVLPLRRAAFDVFSGATALLVVTPVEPPAAPTTGILQALFDLSPAEARVAQGVAQGSSLDELAQLLGVSKETLRTQLRGVFAKTGTARQAELVALLLGASPSAVSKR
jgi:DNA-binding CsgD family transcriptional regulator